MSQVILFDLDGTLTDSGEGIIRSVQYALEKMGITGEKPENLRRFVGPPLKESFMNFYSMSEERAQEAVAYYRERYTKVGIFENSLYPQIPELLEVLRINDKILGVASSKPEVFVKQILKHFEIEQYFQVIVGSELDGTRSRKEEVIEEALARLGMQTERDKILMVGDKEHDVNGAKACGLQCIGVAYGYGTVEELQQAGAVYIAETVEDLGILASPNDEETTEHVESVRKDSREKRERKSRVRKKKHPEKKEEAGEDDEQGTTVLAQGSMYTEGTEGKRMHPLMHIWRIVYPLIIYYGVAVLVSTAFSVWFLVRSKDETGSFQAAQVVGQAMDSSLYMTLITFVIAGILFFAFYRSDEKRRRAGFLGRGADFVWSPPVVWCSVVVLAMAGCQILNDLINIIGLNELFPSYSELADETMSGQPVWLLFLVIGVLAPVAEELLFRGLIFRRMKDWMKPGIAIFISALFFGAYHGNMVQFIYASLMGILMAVIYHRTGTLWTSILAHAVANLWGLFGYSWWSGFMSQIPYGVVIGIAVELLLCVIPGYWIFGNRRKKRKKTKDK